MHDCPEKLQNKTAYNKVLGLSWVSGSWFLERHIAVSILMDSEKCFYPLNPLVALRVDNILFGQLATNLMQDGRNVLENVTLTKWQFLNRFYDTKRKETSRSISIRGMYTWDRLFLPNQDQREEVSLGVWGRTTEYMSVNAWNAT